MNVFKMLTVLVTTAALAAFSNRAAADTFGSGANTFTIDFVTVGNTGNANDAGAGGGSYSSPFGGVGYGYRMGKYEITQDAITKATNLGMTNVTTGPWTGSQPAATTTWYEAAAFANFLNTSTGHQAAYQINAGVTALTLWSSAQAWQLDGENLYRHKDAFYFLPNEDEWYKAAFHKNDGVTANYWDYATGSNSIPTAVASGTTAGTAVYNFMGTQPALVNDAGGLSPYGTMAQNGNVTEWLENASIPPNDSGSEGRTLRSGSRQDNEGVLRSSFSFTGGVPSAQNALIGFRVASLVPPNDADFDNDNDIDGNDFLIWQRGLGGAGGTGNAQGNADGDADIDGNDLAIWKDQFGGTISTVNAQAIPEPAPLTLGVIALATAACFAGARHRRR